MTEPAPVPSLAELQASTEGLFAGLSRAEQQALLAQLELAGGSMYQHWADTEPDPGIRALHLAALEREVQNARFLESLAKK